MHLLSCHFNALEPISAAMASVKAQSLRVVLQVLVILPSSGKNIGKKHVLKMFDVFLLVGGLSFCWGGRFSR